MSYKNMEEILREQMQGDHIVLMQVSGGYMASPVHGHVYQPNLALYASSHVSRWAT